MSMYIGNLVKHSIPIVTTICCLVSIALFIGVNQESELSWDAYRKWGSPPFFEIYYGAYWGLLTTNFLHVEIWHIAFNLYWLWLFGKSVELKVNKVYYIIFIVLAAMISSLGQLAFADSTGIGLSGIVYALFGFLLIKSKKEEEYKDYLDNRTVYLFFIWLVLCIILTKTQIWIVGNAAHVCGLLCGMIAAILSKRPLSLQLGASTIAITLLTILAISGLFSTTYLQSKAYHLHETENLYEAASVYKTILDKEPNNEFAKKNLTLIEVTKLQEKAFKLHTDKQYEEARRTYNQILELDKDNKWAQESLKLLP